MRKHVTDWRRLHAIEPAVTLRVITSPLDGWIVSIDGWTAPSHFRRTHPDIESAQQAAEDVLINYRPHDCKQCGCGEWMPIVSVERKQSDTFTSHEQPEAVLGGGSVKPSCPA